MFSLSVVDTDKFLEMPISARLLYYELGMRADDDGFVDTWKKILIFTGLKEDDLKLLIAKQFIIPFESGVIVIKHWRLNNYLQKDRIKPTIHQEEMKLLGMDENNVYTLDTQCIHSIDKNSIDKNSIDKNSSSIYDHYENEIGVISSRQFQELENFRTKLSDQMIIEAINKTCDSNAKNFNYLRTILNNWINKGYTTIGEIKNEKKEKDDYWEDE